MKKTIAVISAVAMLFGCCMQIYADVPSGLTENENAASEPTASIKLIVENTKGGLAGGYINASRIPYVVSMTAGNRENGSFSINTKCGDKTYSERLELAAGSSATKQYVMEDCPKGDVAISVTVLCNGKEIAVFGGKYYVTPEVQRHFMDTFTRKTAFNWQYDTQPQKSVAEYTGVLGDRTELWRWETVERAKGAYDFSQSSGWMNSLHNTTPLDIMLIVGMGNRIYSETGKGPDTKKYIDAYANYMKAVAKQYPFTKYYEVWNEPNGGDFWVGHNSTDYAYACEVAYRELKKLSPDSVMAVGSVANGDAAFINNIYEENVFSGCDAVSYHPYTRPSGIDTNGENTINQVHDVIMKHGGWKVPLITEIGWPTNNGSMGISENQQAIEVLKACIVSGRYNVPYTVIHALGSGPEDQTNSENFYGVIRYNGTPKPSFHAVREMNQELNGAVYFGKLMFDNENVQMHMYLRDNEITAVAWTKGRDTQISFGGETVTAFDMMGNNKQSLQSVNVGEAPVYIKGLSKKWLAKSLYGDFCEYYGLRISDFDDCIGKTGFEDAKGILLSNIENVKKYSETPYMPVESESLTLLENHYAAGDRIIDMYKNGQLDITIEKLSGLLYLNHLLGIKLGSLYMASADKTDAELGADAAYEKAKNTIGSIKGDNTLSYSEAILEFAKDYKTKADGVNALSESNPMKNGVVTAWDKTAQILSAQAAHFAEAESVGYDNILLQLPSAECNIDLNKDETLNFSLYNYRKTLPLNGHIEVFDPDGNLLGKSENVSLNADESAIVPVSIKLAEKKDGSFKMHFVENGSVIVKRTAHIVITSKLKVSFEPVTGSIDSVSSVNLKLENVYGEKVSGKVEMKSVSDWQLGEESVAFSLDKDEKKDAVFSVTKKVKKPYNFYAFDIKISDDGGNLIYSKILPLDFTVIEKAEKEISVKDFDGDISDWSNAYPIYCDTPENPLDGTQWANEDIGARMFMKWDENYYYMLCDVFDQFHANMQSQTLLWNGDSIQIAFDTLNDGGFNYRVDDYEYGVAATELSDHEVYAWAAGPSNSGPCPGDWAKILVNRDLHLTRYLLRIPAENLAPLNFTEGNVFGFNFLVNDADFTTREKDIEYTYGISIGKAPEAFADFKLIGCENPIPGTPQVPIPVNFNDAYTTENSGGTAFNDTDGHWATAYIQSASAKKLINGMGDGSFKPDGLMTRAEMAAIVSRAAALDTAGYLSPYADVPGSSWYCMSIAALKDNGFIPHDMAELNFYPDRYITREEAACLIDAARKYKNGALGEYRSMIKCRDAAQISDWAVGSFQSLYNLGVICGDETSALMPQSEITRAEAAAMIMRAFSD